MLLKAKPTETRPPTTGSAAAAQATAMAKAKAASRIRGQLMQMALRQLLNQVRGSRDALPHLAALETALGEKGVAAIAEVPPHWLARMAAQLGSLPIREDDKELNELLRRLCNAVEARQDPKPDMGRVLPDYQASGHVEVQEVSHSEFVALLDGNPQPAQSK